MLERLAGALRRAADTAGKQKIPLAKAAYLQDDCLLGAALLWSFLRDLLTVTERETWKREELLVALETIARDRDIFPAGLVELIADLDKEEETNASG